MPAKISLPDHTSILKDVATPLLRWYHAQETERQLPWREDPSPYHVWLSEIMLQQTRAAAVIPYYENFLHELPTVHDLAHCDDDRLMKLWQGLGYYSRARNLKKAAQVIVTDYGGELPADYKALRALPGIGDYTAGAIASIAFGLPTPAVDGNVLRTVTRLLAWPADVLAASTKRATFELLAPHYPAGHEAGALNQAFMDLGATVCLPHGTPHCAHCPLTRLCLAHAEGCELTFPHKKAKKARRQEKLTVFILHQGSAIALHRRPDTGLLAGLWEFPHTKGHLSQAAARQFLETHGLPIARLQSLPAARHIFSHIEWHMHAYEVWLADDALQIADPPVTLRWVPLAEIHQNYSIPSAFQYFLPHG